MSSIQLHNITFTRNNLMQYLLYMESNSSAIVNNNAIVGNNMDVGVFVESSNLEWIQFFFKTIHLLGISSGLLFLTMLVLI